jgi:thymidylate kinase
MYELARRRAASRVVLADEGTVLTAYHVFVLAALEFGPDELERFARLVPLPDRIVYVRAPVAALVERAATRDEGRRQLPPGEIDRVEATIRRTVDLFDLLVTAAPIRDRVLVVDNDDGDDIRRRRLVAAIAARLEAEAPGTPASDHESLRLPAEPRS